MEIVVCYFSALSLYIFFCCVYYFSSLLFSTMLCTIFTSFPASSFCIYIILVLHFLPSARNIHSTWLTSCTHRLQQLHSTTTTWLRCFIPFPACLVNWTLSSACCMLLAMVFRDNFIVIFYTFFPPLLFPSRCSYEKLQEKRAKFISSKRHDNVLKLLRKKKYFFTFFLSLHHHQFILKFFRRLRVIWFCARR